MFRDEEARQADGEPTAPLQRDPKEGTRVSVRSLPAVDTKKDAEKHPNISAPTCNSAHVTREPRWPPATASPLRQPLQP